MRSGLLKNGQWRHNDIDRGDMDMGKMGMEFIKMIEFWKLMYGRKKDESD